MKEGRDKRVGEEIRREVSLILHSQLKDPRVMGATVTRVKMSPDLRLARIYFAMPGCEDRRLPACEGLKRASPYVRRLLAQAMQMKYIPQIDFFYDDSLELEKKIHDIFANMPSPATGEDEVDE